MTGDDDRPLKQVDSLDDVVTPWPRPTTPGSATLVTCVPVSYAEAYAPRCGNIKFVLEVRNVVTRPCV